MDYYQHCLSERLSTRPGRTRSSPFEELAPLRESYEDGRSTRKMHAQIWMLASFALVYAPCLYHVIFPVSLPGSLTVFSACLPACSVSLCLSVSPFLCLSVCHLVACLVLSSIRRMVLNPRKGALTTSPTSLNSCLAQVTTCKK